MKFNKNKCFFASVYVAAVSAMTFTGFTSYAAEQNAQINETLSLIRGEEIQWAVSEIVQNAQKTTVEETLTAVNEAKAAYEAKLEEERKAAEEAERIAREQAEKAAALQAEKELMASLIFCEAGNQPYEGQVAVGAVVLNRVKSSVYPNSVSEVIYQSGQFSPAMSGWLDRVQHRWIRNADRRSFLPLIFPRECIKQKDREIMKVKGKTCCECKIHDKSILFSGGRIMDICLPIRDIYVRKILDSGGSPAVEAEVLAGEDIVGTASVAGQKGEQEIEAGIEQMHSQIAEELIGKNLFEQEEIDHLLEKRKEIPQEVSLAVSIATARAAAGKLKLSLYRYLGGTHALKLPALLILAADGTAEETEMDFRELMLVPKGISSVQGQIRAAGEIDSLFREALKKRNGREGEPDRKKQDAADGGVLKLLEKAVEEAGYQCGKEIFFAVNAGAGRLYEKQSGVYRFPAESRRCGQRVERSREELIEYLTRLTGEYPISLLEDPLYREDREGIQELEKKLEDREDCEKKTVLGRRSVMIDPGEIYTLTELSERVREVTEQGKGIILCRQRKETEDAALVDAAVAFGIGQMKLGSPGCLEAAVKYNRLLKLEEKLGKSLGTDCP